MRKSYKVTGILLALWLVPIWISYLARPTPLKCFERSVCSPVPESVANITCEGEEWFGSMRGVICFFRFTIANDHFSQLIKTKGFQRVHQPDVRIDNPPSWFRPPRSGEFFARRHDGHRTNATEYLCMDETGTNAWFALSAPD